MAHVKNEIEQLLHAALSRLKGSVLPADVAAGRAWAWSAPVTPANGDFATNIAMRLAKAAGMKPRDLAQAIVAALPASPQVQRVEIAGAGFINFFLAGDAQADVVRRIHEQGDAFGRNGSGGGRKVIVEFVSSNPTGPLHVGHGRHGAFGASVSNLLDANGYAVHREYYINDAGRQMDILAVSIWLRYLEACGEKFRFPANGYKGEYVREIAAQPAAEGGPEAAAPRGRGVRQPAARRTRGRRQGRLHRRAWSRARVR